MQLSSRPIVPRLPGARGMRVPQLKLPRAPRREQVGEVPSQVVPKGEFDVGPGPWYVQGKKASKPEFQIARILNRLGWRYSFQEAHFGGRAFPGGQVVDFVLRDTHYPIVIDARGYYHKGAAGEANDARKMLQIRATAPMVKILVIYEEQAANEEFLYALLLRELGGRGH